MRYPEFSKSKLTKRVSYIIAVTCLLLIAGFFVHLPFQMEIKLRNLDKENGIATESSCEPVTAEYKTFYETTFMATIFVLFSFIPMLLILIPNSIIIATLSLHKRRMRNCNPARRVHQRNSYNKMRSSSRMILLVSAFFIITTLPYSLKRALDSTAPPNNDKQRAQRILLDSFLIFLTHCNFTFNFVLYCVGGTLFNQELKAFINEYRRKVLRLFSRRVATDNRRVFIIQNNSKKSRDPEH